MASLVTMPQVIDPTPEQQQLTAIATKCGQLAERAKSLTIACVEDRRSAGELFLVIKAARKDLVAITKPEQDEAYQRHRALVAKFKAIDDPAAMGEMSLERKILAWDREQKAILQAEQARQQAEADRKAREDAQREAAERRLREVEAALTAGKEKQAEKLMEKPLEVGPVYVPPVVLQSEKPVIKGESTRQNWKFRIVNPALVPDEFWLLDETRIGKLVRVMKDKTNIPGVEAYPDDSLSGRV